MNNKHLINVFYKIIFQSNFYIMLRIKNISALIFFAVLGLWGCSNNEDYDKVPDPIITFITDYWPNPVIDSYTQPSANEYEIDIKDGPILTFNSDYDWTSIDGHGLPLPSQLLYDQLPGKLYNYLEGGEYLGQVFSISRNSREYYVELLNTNVTYIISSQTITEGPSADTHPNAL